MHLYVNDRIKIQLSESSAHQLSGFLAKFVSPGLMINVLEFWRPWNLQSHMMLSIGFGDEMGIYPANPSNHLDFGGFSLDCLQDVMSFATWHTPLFGVVKMKPTDELRTIFNFTRKAWHKPRVDLLLPHCQSFFGLQITLKVILFFCWLEMFLTSSPVNVCCIDLKTVRSNYSSFN